MSRTIAAISTAGYGAIGVIKISGNRSKKILEELFKNAGKQRIESDKWQNKRLYYGTIEQDNRVLDEVMAVYMKAPHTYTREDVVEIYTHGNAVCQRRILDAVIDYECTGLCCDHGARDGGRVIRQLCHRGRGGGPHGALWADGRG